MTNVNPFNTASESHRSPSLNHKSYRSLNSMLTHRRKR